MIDLDIAGLQQALDVNWLYRVGTFALLFSIQAPFLELKAFGHLTEVLGEQCFVFVVAFAIFVLLVLDFPALVDGSGKIACHFDMHRMRRAVLTNERIRYLSRLVERA